MNERIDVDALARLARMALSEEEKQEMVSDLETMLAFGRTLSEADLPDFSTTTRGVDTFEALATLRTDEPMVSLDRGAIMEMAASASDGYVTVARVLSGEEKEGAQT